MKFSLWYPIKANFVSQPFGNVTSFYKENGINIDAHNGIDYPVADGTPVYAAHDGLAYPEIDDRGGNGVVIKTQSTYDYRGSQVFFKTIYWHLKNAYAVVRPGQFVRAGDLIGYADNTGFSTGSHLHFGLKPFQFDPQTWQEMNVDQNNGTLGAIDPVPYFNKYFAQDRSRVELILTSLVDLLKQAVALSRR